MASALTASACKPPPVHCKITTYKYDYQTKLGPFTKTWFTLYNEMRFCYNGYTVTSITAGYTDNRTSVPTPPYTRDGVDSTTRLESYLSDRNRKRAYNSSRHAIGCVKIINGFDITLNQRGYPDGSVQKWHSTPNAATDC
ncbi:hypothetical protein KSP35_14165 [Aquihabitans sp. G128]|uniref:hypothetical protein n=1 Tax=Aquihabitans sp. G128 TaxID=2849779 RepID=UPI001C2357F6|nr:hypothetical protein [Aquihabitans sp. G128]QXC59529.1 hypothetical protein KSP35_14165 [Aquihabitans sp. G128]